VAACSITNGEAAEILTRLTPLVASPHWRNTWLLAAGTLFSERQRMRSELMTVIERHDHEGMINPGTQSKTVLTDVGPVEIDVPRDRDASFEPKIVAKRQRRLGGVDDRGACTPQTGQSRWALGARSGSRLGATPWVERA
jgi:hypothetical protein